MLDLEKEWRRLASPAAREFLVDVCRRFADRGTLRIFSLKIRDKTVATRIGFANGDSLYLYYSGFDPRFARYSIMTTTVAEAIRYAIEHGFRSVNLSTGSDVSKTRWRPNVFKYQQAVILSPSRRATWTHEAYHLALRAAEQPSVRSLLSRIAARRVA